MSKVGMKGGKGAGKFGGAGAGAGYWAFVPAAQPQSWSAPAYSQRAPAYAPAVGSIKGAGKGKSKSPKMDKLGKMEAAVKVWVGGLAESTTWKKLEKHFEDVAKAKLTEIMGRGKACVAFDSEEDAQTCIGAFNGSELDGNTIEVDVWTQKERKEGEEPRKGKGKGKGEAAKGAFVKGAGKGASKDKGGKSKSLGSAAMKAKFKEVANELKVWVGGLSPKTKLKDLKQHFIDHGCEPKLADLMKPGTACLSFETVDDVETAVGACNGSELDEKALEVDVWVKPEKKD